MNILFAPYNIASMQEITAASIEKVGGHKVRCLYFGKHKYNTFSANATVLYAGQNKFLRWVYKFFGFFFMLRLILWADVIHWVWDSAYPAGIDLWLCKLFKKKLFVEWVGSDIRVPEVLMAKNKWYKEAFQNGYEYVSTETMAKSHRIQDRFRKFGFRPVLVPEMKMYLKSGVFNKVYDIQYRIDTKKYKPNFPDRNNRVPLIVHSPSARIAKGSIIIENVIRRLQEKYEFEYMEIHNYSHEECLSFIGRCDIFIDQIVIGSYAMAAIEAMSFGKPVFAYLLDEIINQDIDLPCPIVNVNPETLEEKLALFIQDAELRYKTGVLSRQFVEQIHDADLLAEKLILIYNDTL